MANPPPPPHPGIPDAAPLAVSASAAPDTGRARAGGSRELLRKLGPTGVLGVLWTAMPAIMGILLLANIETLSAWLKEHEGLGLVGYVAVFIVSAGLGLLPTYAQSILGGWVFGAMWGLPGALAGFTGGAIVGYFTAKTVSQDRVEKVIESRPKWRAVRDALVGGGFWKTLGMVALVRLPPNSPFALTNLVLSTTGVRLLPYALGTALGMFPRTALAVGLAAAAASSSGAAGLREFLAEGAKNKFLLVGGGVMMVVVLGIIGHIANKTIARVTRAGYWVCPKCGYDVGRNALVCPECGAELRGKVGGVEVENSPANEPAAQARTDSH